MAFFNFPKIKRVSPMRKIHLIGLFFIAALCFSLAPPAVQAAIEWEVDTTFDEYYNNDGLQSGVPYDGYIVIGRHAYTVFTQISGEIHIIGDNQMHVGQSVGGKGSQYIMQGGSLIAPGFKLGNESTGHMIQTGGTVSVGYLLISNHAHPEQDVQSTYTISGNSKLEVSGETILGVWGGVNNGRLTINLSGPSDDFYVKTNTLTVGDSSAGTVELQNGLLSVADKITIGKESGSSGVFDVTGGKLLIGSGGVWKGGGSAEVNFRTPVDVNNNVIGVLGDSAGHTWDANLNLNFYGDGIAFEAGENQTITIASKLVGQQAGYARLIKTGSGVVELTGDNVGESGKWAVAEVVFNGTLRRSAGNGYGQVWIADSWDGHNAYYELTGSGKLYGEAMVGVNSGTGTMKVFGGGEVDNNWINISPYSQKGTLEIGSGGTVKTGDVRVGDQGTLILNDGGLLRISNRLYGNGAVNLLGGTIEALPGGFLWESSATLAAGTNTTLNTAGQEVNIKENVSFSGGGTLTKTGDGTLVFNHPNTSFTGNLVIDRGMVTLKSDTTRSIGEGGKPSLGGIKTFDPSSTITIKSGGVLFLDVMDALGYLNGNPAMVTIESGGELRASGGDNPDKHQSVGAITLIGGKITSAGHNTNGPLADVHYIFDRDITVLPAATHSQILVDGMFLRRYGSGGDFAPDIAFDVQGDAWLEITSWLASLTYGDTQDINKKGSGTLELSGNNNMYGDTGTEGWIAPARENVFEGTLIRSGGTTKGDINVATGGGQTGNYVLTGGAIDTSAITVGGDGLGTFSLIGGTVKTGSYTQGAGSTLEVYLNLDPDGTLSNSFLDITGSLSLDSDAILNLVLTGDGWLDDALFDGVSAEIFRGYFGDNVFSNITSTGYSLDGYQWSYDAGWVSLGPMDNAETPEPAAWVLMFLGLAGMAGMVRRRR